MFDGTARGLSRIPALHDRLDWSNPHFVCIQRLAASVCQPDLDACAFIPSSERSSVKSPDGRLTRAPARATLGAVRKNAERDAIAAACAAAVSAARVVNR